MPGPDQAPERDNMLAQAYVAAFQANPPSRFIANLATTLRPWHLGDRVVPLSVNASEPTGTYVCSPHTAYIRYAREELRTLPVRHFDLPLRGLIGLFDHLLRAARIDDIVHLNNWLLSTNLNGGLTVRDGKALADELVASFPNSLLAWRSLNPVAHGALMRALRSGGWHFLPSRQIYLVEDLARDWRSRTDTKQDAKLMRDGRYSRDDFPAMGEADAVRIAELYASLYLDKYSSLNPAFTPDFIRLSHALDMIRYVGLRDASGGLQAVAGCFRLGSEITTPIVGYDPALPREEGLYRRASYLISETALEMGLRLNLSSGAAAFKRNRGGKAAIEYCAVHLAHLPAARRLPIGALRLLLTGVGVPLMEKYQL
jgi:hypothetical protein